MRISQLGALHQSIGRRQIVNHHDDCAERDQHSEQSEVRRRQRSREHYQSADSNDLERDLTDHVVANAAREGGSMPTLDVRDGADVTRHWHHIPLPCSIAGRVRSRIPISPTSDQSSMYSISSCTICSNDNRLRPLTCHSPVIPGAASSRCRCHSWYNSSSYGIAGRGPIRLMFP